MNHILDIIIVLSVLWWVIPLLPGILLLALVILVIVAFARVVLPP